MENEGQSLYVCDPVINKDGVTSFTSYSLKGTRTPEPRSRRYRDFDALRRKFVERWPGVFIPNIPHKKTVGSTDKGIVDLRIEQINRFLKKLSSIDYLYNSDEMELFLQNSDNIPKTLDNIKEDSYQEILKKYSQVFTDYDDNFDTIVGKNEQDEFYKQLNAMYPKLRAFRAFILGEKERFNLFQKNSNILMNMLCIYERDVVKVCVNDDENKLVFFNQKNDFNNIISNAQKKVINPYDKLYDSFTEDYLDTEAMIEALESLKNLQEIYNKLTKNLTSITKLPALEINSTQAYYSMFQDSNVKASATATSECSYAYRVPTSGTGTADSKSLTNMFSDASGTGNFTPTVNTTFYINVPSF